MSDTKRADVALLRCEDYEDRKLETAIAQVAEIAGFPEVRGATVLLKPNVLNASPATKAVTTHPSFVGAVIKFVRSRGAKEVLVGDSPGWQPGTLAAKVCGIYESVQKHGGVWVDFGEASPFPITNGKKLKNLPLTTALRRADFVVNLPKLKNHHLMTYTGAMKNLFGLIPGTAKSAMHLQYPNVADFGRCSWILPSRCRDVSLLWTALSPCRAKGLVPGPPTLSALCSHRRASRCSTGSQHGVLAMILRAFSMCSTACRGPWEANLSLSRRHFLLV